MSGLFPQPQILKSNFEKVQQKETTPERAAMKIDDGFSAERLRS